MSIPLTIDWLTVTWLKLRLSLWLKRKRLPLLALGLMALLTGCVPVTSYEEAQSAAQVEQAGRQRAEAQLQAQQAENKQLQARMAQQGSAMQQQEQALAQAELDGSVQGKQREEAAGMVEQLRGELARVSNHLRTFQDDKQKLEASRLAESERGRALVRLTRDLALTLSEPIATGSYGLDAEQGRAVLRVPREQLLAEDGTLKPSAEPVLQALTRVLQLNESAKLRVEDSGAPGDAVAVASVVSALGQRSLGAERFEPLALGPDAAPAVAESAPASVAEKPALEPAARELRFGLSVP